MEYFARSVLGEAPRLHSSLAGENQAAGREKRSGTGYSVRMTRRAGREGRCTPL